jgi:predicted PurR-regulated permease PerM
MEILTPEFNFYFVFILLPMGIFLIPYLFFIRTQYSTLLAIQPENRLMNPLEVWLQLIPVFGLIWQFVVVARIADSIQREYQSHKEISFLGMGDGDLQEKINERVTYTTGFSYCVLLILSFIPVIGFMIGIAMLALWFTYWRQLIKHRDIMLESGL